MLFSFKYFRETATCLLWRVWHHGSGRLLLHAIGRAVGIFKSRLDWLARSRFQQCRGLIAIPTSLCVALTHTHSTQTHTLTYTPHSFCRLLRCGRTENTNRWNNLPPICWWGSSSYRSQLHQWIYYLRRSPVRIAKSVARLPLQRKYAFRAGEQPISRGEPKINKPYDKTKLCKTSIMFLISTLWCLKGCCRIRAGHVVSPGQNKKNNNMFCFVRSWSNWIDF